MANRKMEHTYVPFDGASIIERKHEREIKPPGFIDLENFIPPRSDSSPTLRPDIWGVNDFVYSIESLINFNNVTPISDTVIAATGLSGENQLLYFTPFLTWGSNDGSYEILSDVHTDGNVSGSVGDTTIRGFSTAFHEKAYRGAVLKLVPLGTPEFSGAPYRFVDSTYDASLQIFSGYDDVPISVLGDQLIFITENSSYPYYFGSQRLIDEMTNDTFAAGDEDSIGYDALYIKTGNNPNIQEATAGDYNTYSSSGPNLELGFGTYIGGSDLEWVDSSIGGLSTEIWYLAKKSGGGPPDFVPNQGNLLHPVYASSYMFSEYMPNFGRLTEDDQYPRAISQQVLYAEPNDLNLDVTRDHAMAIGNEDSLSGDTYYIKSNPYGLDSDDPTDRKNIKSYQDFFISPTYNKISDSPYSWAVSSGSPKVFYLQKSGGDPKIPRPSGLAWTYPEWTRIKGSIAQTIIDEDDGITESNFRTGWAWGDDDSLGYDTVYLYSAAGDPDLDTTRTYYSWHVQVPYYQPWPTISSGVVGYPTSKYSWAASATSGEWYLVQADGSELEADFPEPLYVTIGSWFKQGPDGAGQAELWDENYTKGVIGSLNDLEWSYGALAGDTLTYDTVYIRYDGDGAGTIDPDSIYLPVVAHYKYDIYLSKYTWTEFSSNIWYLTNRDGTDPGLTEPSELTADGVSYAKQTSFIGLDAVNKFWWGDQASTLGFNSIWIYSTSDPNGTAGTGYQDEVPPAIFSTEVEEDPEYYLVDSIIDDTKLRVYGTLSSTFNNAVPTFYYNHNTFNSDYKLNIQGYTAGIIYSSPNIDSNSLDADISGPFYAGLERGAWAYSGTIGVDENFEGNGVLFETQPNLAEKVGIHVLIFGSADTQGSGADGLPNTQFLGYSANPAAPNAWTRLAWNIKYNYDEDGEQVLTPQVVVQGDTEGMALNSIQGTDGNGWVCGAQCLDREFFPSSAAEQCNPGIAWSNSAIPTLWNTIINTNYAEWADVTGETRAQTDYQCICAARNVDECVALVWQPSSNTVSVDYCADIQAATPTFSQEDSFQGTVASKVYYLNDTWFIIFNQGLMWSTDGQTWNDVDLSAIATNITDFAWDGKETYMISFEDMEIAYTLDYDQNDLADPDDPDPANDPYSWNVVTILDEPFHEYLDFIRYDQVGERWIANTQRNFWWSEDGIEWKFLVNQELGDSGTEKRPTNPVTSIGYNVSVLFDGGANYVRALVTERFNYYYWTVDKFVPLSDIYRASTFSVIEGYVGLFSTLEYEKQEDGTYDWVSYPRRFRWTAPATYNDFDAEFGAGLADAPGEGKFLDSRPVNGRIVAFETNKVSAVVPRGDLDDPFEYEVIQEDFRILSNPLKVNDIVYVVGSDGLIYGTDGINVKEAGFAYDATKYEDYQEKKPIALDYSRATNSLIAFYYDSTADNQEVTFISLSGGSVTRCVLPNHDDNTTQPTSICSVASCDDQRILVPYIPNDTQTTTLRLASFTFGQTITGMDRLGLDGVDTTRWASTIETGEIYIQPEGNKASIKHIIVSTYTGATIGDGDDTPRIIVQIKPTGSDTWLSPRQFNWDETLLTVTTSSATIDEDTYGIDGFPTSLIWDNEVSGTTGDFYMRTPIDSRLMHLMVTTDGGTTFTEITSDDYTIEDEEIPNELYFPAGSFSANTFIYGLWKGRPHATMEVNDMLQLSDGYHRITELDNYNKIGLEYYPAETLEVGAVQGNPKVYHYKTVQLEVGDGKAIYGMNQLVEGFRLRVVVIPEHGSDNAPTSVKIVGMSVGFVPQGRKTLTATGS